MKLADQFWPLFYRLQFYADVPSVLQILKFRQLRARYFGAMWRAAAAEAGAAISEAGGGYFRIDRNGLSTFVRNSEVMIDSHLMLDMMGNKPMTQALLRELGVAAPRSLAFTMQDLPEAEAFMAAAGGEIVVKPAGGTGGGRGVTTGITGLDALRKAARYASRYDSNLLAEEFIAGESYRLLYLDGECLDAVHRQSPVLTGDGKHTIRQLMKIENAKRLAGAPVTALSPLKADRDCQNKLARQGLALSTVLEAQRTIVVKQAVNENDNTRNHSVRARVHPGTIALGERIVTSIGVRLAGLDLICQDISQPLEDGNGCFNEINTTPGLHHHYLISSPASGVPAARQVLDYMFSQKLGVMTLGRPSAPRTKSLTSAGSMAG